VVEALGFFREPIDGVFRVEENGALHMVGGAALDFGAFVFVGDGVNGAQVGVGGEGGERVGAGAGEQIHNAAGKVAGGQHFAEEDGGVGLAVGGEGDDGVAAGDGGEDHGEQAKKWGFLGGEEADDAHGFHDGEIEVGRGDGVHAAEEGFVFVGPAGVVGDAVDGGADFARGGVAIRAGDREGGGHFLAAGFEHFGEAIEDLSAVVGAASGPAGTGFGGGFDGVAEILASAEGDVADELTGGVVEGIDAAALGANERAADEAFRGFCDG